MLDPMWFTRAQLSTCTFSEWCCVTSEIHCKNKRENAPKMRWFYVTRREMLIEIFLSQICTSLTSFSYSVNVQILKLDFRRILIEDVLGCTYVFLVCNSHQTVCFATNISIPVNFT